MASQQNAAMQDTLAARFRKLYDPARAYAEAVATRLAITGLVGFWAGSQHGGGTDGAWADVSGNGQHATRNGTPNSRMLNDLSPAMFFSGSSDYYRIAHNNSIQITGLEGSINTTYRGITAICWFRPSALGLGTQNQFLGKAISTAGDVNNSYSLLKGSSDNFQFYIYNGTSTYASGAVAAATLSEWQCVIGRYIPSVEVTCWKGYQGQLTKLSNTTSIPASANNATSTAFGLGGNGDGSNLHTGYLALPTLYETALPDHLIEMIYQIDRPIFND